MGSEDDARTLIRALGLIPLAITQAAAYLAVRPQAKNFSRYLLLFRESNQANILSNKAVTGIRRDDSVSHAVITAWQISFDQIQKTIPEAADLLALMAMFVRQAIPESIVSVGRTNLQFEDALSLLSRYFLINVLATKKKDSQFEQRLFDMHELVKLATRKWLEIKGQIRRWRKAFLRIIAAAFPSRDHETWGACRALLPQPERCSTMF